MTSKRRLRRRTCQRKQRYPTRRAARSAIYHQRHKWTGQMSAYGPCPWCGGYHIGHTPKQNWTQP